MSPDFDSIRVFVKPVRKQPPAWFSLFEEHQISSRLVGSLLAHYFLEKPLWVQMAVEPLANRYRWTREAPVFILLHRTSCRKTHSLPPPQLHLLVCPKIKLPCAYCGSVPSCVSSLTADFGLSKIIDDQVTMKTVCGTPGYCGKFSSVN